MIKATTAVVSLSLYLCWFGVSQTTPKPAGSSSDLSRVGEITVIGAKTFTPKQVVAFLGINQGDKVSQYEIDKALERLRDDYLKRGFLQVEVRAKKEVHKQSSVKETTVVTLTVEIVEGISYTIRRVEIYGNEKTNYRKVLRAARLRPGVPYHPSLVAEWIKGLNKSGLFQKVSENDIKIHINDQEHFVDLVFNIREK
jgi:outer membrane protein assembly factor BamA